MENKEALLIDYWRGTLDPRQQQEVEEWIEASPVNRQTALKYCRLEQYVTEYVVMQQSDEEELLRKADRNTRGVNTKRNPHFWKRQRWPLYAGLCAVLAVAILIGWLGLKHTAEIMAKTEIVCRTGNGEIQQILLPDDTKVWLNANSVIYYPEEFKGKNRKVRVEGNFFFDVTQDEEHPFVVETKDCLIKVRGTQFEVDAYPDNVALFRATLVSGSVELIVKKNNRHNPPTLLVPGQRFTYNASDNSASISYVDTESLTSWRTGRISFYHTPLTDVLTMIGNTFGIRFVINKAGILDENYTGTFDNRPLDEVLSTLEQVTSLRFKQLVVTDTDIYPRYLVY